MAFPVSYSDRTLLLFFFYENLCHRTPAVIDPRMTGNKLRGQRGIFMSQNKLSPMPRTNLLRSSSLLVNGTRRRSRKRKQTSAEYQAEATTGIT